MPRISNAARNGAADSIADRVDAGSAAGVIQIRDGIAPDGPDSAATGSLLVEITLADPAFSSAASGVVTLAGTPLSDTAIASGTASWFRILDDNDTAIIDGDVGTSGADLNLNTTSISTGLTVQINSGSFTMPAE